MRTPDMACADESTCPPVGKTGTVVAWSDSNKATHGLSKGHESSLAWKDLAVVDFGNGKVGTYRIGFMGDY